MTAALSAAPMASLSLSAVQLLGAGQVERQTADPDLCADRRSVDAVPVPAGLLS